MRRPVWLLLDLFVKNRKNEQTSLKVPKQACGVFPQEVYVADSVRIDEPAAIAGNNAQRKRAVIKHRPGVTARHEPRGGFVGGQGHRSTRGIVHPRTLQGAINVFGSFCGVRLGHISIPGYGTSVYRDCIDRTTRFCRNHHHLY